MPRTGDLASGYSSTDAQASIRVPLLKLAQFALHEMIVRHSRRLKLPTNILQMPRRRVPVHGRGVPGPHPVLHFADVVLG